MKAQIEYEQKFDNRIKHAIALVLGWMTIRETQTKASPKLRRLAEATGWLGLVLEDTEKGTLAEVERMVEFVDDAQVTIKCAPALVTERMIEAAEEAYMPFGDMGTALQVALCEAPEDALTLAYQALIAAKPVIDSTITHDTENMAKLNKVKSLIDKALLSVTGKAE